VIPGAGTSPGAGSRADHRDRDAGAATVLAAVLILGLLVVLGFGLALGSAVLTRHRAEGAADLAALAAAAHAPGGERSACIRARQVVAAAHADVLNCALTGLDARVEVTAPTPALPGMVTSQVSARARAGPVAR